MTKDKQNHLETERGSAAEPVSTQTRGSATEPVSEQTRGNAAESVSTTDQATKLNPLTQLVDRLTTIFEDKKVQLLAILAGLVTLVILPFLGFNSYIMNIMVKVILYTIMALGLNILVGFTGLVSLGQAGFVAIGAYTTAILTKEYGVNFFVAMLLACVLTALCGLLLGLPTLRLTGTYLSIITLGFGEIVRTIIIVWDEVTNGPLGMRGMPSPELFGVRFTMANNGIYYLSLILLVLVSLFCYMLYRSKVGRALKAIKNDETASIMMGVNVTAYKVLAFVLAAAISSLASSLFTIQLGYIDQNTFTFDMSTMILSIVILGGMGTIRGMYVGSLIVVLLPEISRSLMDYRFVIYGAILVLMMRFRPQGLLGWKSRAPYPVSSGAKAAFNDRVLLRKQNREAGVAKAEESEG